MMTSSATILYPDITQYMGSITGGSKIDEEKLTQQLEQGKH